MAAGSADSDAVNVAQLKAAGTAGLNFKGDGDTVVHRDLADTLNITGGITDADSLTEDNIGVVADDAKVHSTLDWRRILLWGMEASHSISYLV